MMMEQAYVYQIQMIRHPEELGVKWGLEFFVCEHCKLAYFADYKNAIICREDCCTVCGPRNDGTN